MQLIKNTASNAAELYKLLGNNKMVYYNRLGPTHIDKSKLLLNPASNSVTVYTKDGSDYDVYINEITAIINQNLN